MLLNKNPKPNLKLYNTLYPNLKYYRIKNLSTCVIYSFKTKFKVFEKVVIFNIFLVFFISKYITFVKFFFACLIY